MKNYCPESLAAYFLLNLMKSDLSYQIESFLIHSQDDYVFDSNRRLLILVQVKQSV